MEDLIVHFLIFLMKYLMRIQPDLHPLDCFSYLAIYVDRGDLAEFGKKRNTDHDFPSSLYVGGK